MVVLYKWAHDPGRTAHCWYPDRDWLFSMCGRSAKHTRMIDGGKRRCKACLKEITEQYERLTWRDE